jgi:hypothetical protein
MVDLGRIAGKKEASRRIAPEAQGRPQHTSNVMDSAGECEDLARQGIRTSAHRLGFTRQEGEKRRASCRELRFACIWARKAWAPANATVICAGSCPPAGKRREWA